MALGGRGRQVCFGILVSTNLATAALADDGFPPLTYGIYGTPGMIEMPIARSAPDAELALTLGGFAGGMRSTLSFQITPRLSGSFRYARIDNWVPATGEPTYDRSFDLRYRLLDEGRYRPAVAVGLQDIVGTGIYAAEYLVATKAVTPTVNVTSGLGWGRLGTHGGLRNPLAALDDSFATRPDGFTDTGGQLETGRWFRGDVAPFGGFSWQATDRLALLAEYSSDAYVLETDATRQLFDRATPWNLGAHYALSDQISLQAYALYGRNFGAALTVRQNPRFPAAFGGSHKAPPPIMGRAAPTGDPLAWQAQPGVMTILQGNLRRLLAAEGLVLEAFAVEATTATVVFRNDRYVTAAEALGRVARVMTQVMPASVTRFVLVPSAGGLHAAQVDIARADLETLAFDPDQSAEMARRISLRGPAPDAGGLIRDAAQFPAFTWQFGPYLSTSYFDPDSPIRAAIGAELAVRYEPRPGLQFRGVLRQPIAGNLADGRGSDSLLPPVRTNAARYAAAGQPALSELSASYRFGISPDVYGRVTAGYLEPMFGGVSAEVLWKPVDSRLGLGVEVNRVAQRDFDQLFGFQDYRVTSGHASVYYVLGGDYHAQLDLGRYLAGDLGATIQVERVFDNGWRLGAFATFTDVDADRFGEGGFDKGLRLQIPLGHFVGNDPGRVARTTLRPLTRDGGARLQVGGRLYDSVRQYHAAELEGGWGRFWR